MIGSGSGYTRLCPVPLRGTGLTALDSRGKSAWRGQDGLLSDNIRQRNPTPGPGKRGILRPGRAVSCTPAMGAFLRNPSTFFLFSRDHVPAVGQGTVLAPCGSPGAG